MDKGDLWRFILFHAEQSYEQYRHLDNIRERYVTLWLSICAFLIGGSLLSTWSQNPSVIVYLSLIYLVVGLLGDAVCLMAIQIRSTQIREALFIIYLRRKMLKFWGKGSEQESELSRLLAWSELAANPKILNFHSSTVTLIFFVSILSSSLISVSAYFSLSLDFFALLLLGSSILICHLIVVGLYLWFLDGRLEFVSAELKRQIEANELDVDALLKIAQKAPDTN